jgi:hypothetical protein
MIDLFTIQLKGECLRRFYFLLNYYPRNTHKSIASVFRSLVDEKYETVKHLDKDAVS